MKTVYLLVAFLTALTGAVNAQYFPLPALLEAEACPTAAIYTVAKGDILYNKHGVGWKLLLPVNPRLEDRVSGPDGREIAIIYPRDRICVPEGLLPVDFISRPDTTQASTESSSSASTRSTEAQVASTVSSQNQEIPFWKNYWFWVTMGTLISSIWGLSYLYRSMKSNKREMEKRIDGLRESNIKQEASIKSWRGKHDNLEAKIARDVVLSSNPVTSGNAMVKGGLTSENIDEAFLNMAERQWHRMGNTTPLPRKLFTIVSLKRGRAWGLLKVVYRVYTNNPKQLEEKERRLNGQRVYEANVLFPGIEEPVVLYALEGCGNDLHREGIASQTTADDFRFEPDDDGLSEKIEVKGSTPSELLPVLRSTAASIDTAIVIAGGKNGKTP